MSINEFSALTDLERILQGLGLVYLVLLEAISMQYVRKAWQHVRKAGAKFLEDVEFYVTLAIGVSALTLELLHIINEEVVLSLILAMLAVVAFSIARNRHSIEGMLNEAKKDSSGNQAANLAIDDSVFRGRLETAREVSILTVANPAVVYTNAERLLDVANRGGIVRYCIVNPRGAAIEMATARDFYTAGSNVTHVPSNTPPDNTSRASQSPEASVGVPNTRPLDREAGSQASTVPTRQGHATDSRTQLYQEIVACLGTMDFLRRRAINGRIEIKIIDVLPSTLITMIDPEVQAGIMFVTVLGFRQSYADCPSFLYYKKSNRERFEFYRTTFEEIWNWEGARSLDPMIDLSALPLNSVGN